MSFVELNVTDAQEAQVVPELKYDLSVTEAILEDGKKPGAKNIRVMITIDGEDRAAPIFTYLSLPNRSDDDKAGKFKKLQIRRFLYAFDIAYDENGFNLEDWFGARGSCLVTVEEYEGRETNRLQLPRLPDEGEVFSGE